MADKPEETSDYQHIWLRYATQFNEGGRTYTVEMGIPVPLGASNETREQLIHEAEVGMDQLSAHVEKLIAQVIQRNQSSSVGKQMEPKSTSPAPKPVAPPAPQPPSKPVNGSTPVTASSLPPKGTSQPSQQGVPSAQTQPVPGKEIQVPPTRPQIGGSMPVTPGMISDASGNLSRPQFIQYIRDSLGLNPRQAMDLLKVRTLDGINLREALNELQRLVLQEGTTTAAPAQTVPNSKPREAAPTQPEDQPTKPAVPVQPTTTAARPASSSAPATSKPPVPPPPVKVPAPEVEHGPVRESPVPYAFDEELDLDDEENEDEGQSEPMGLTTADRVLAKGVLTRLRDARGSNTASPSRLKVLQNLMGSQLSEKQLQHLIDGVWGVTSLKELKVDQVEALIFWAKEDDFMNEADLVLALIQEEQYARSDR